MKPKFTCKTWWRIASQQIVQKDYASWAQVTIEFMDDRPVAAYFIRLCSHEEYAALLVNRSLAPVKIQALLNQRIRSRVKSTQPKPMRVVWREKADRKRRANGLHALIKLREDQEK